MAVLADPARDIGSRRIEGLGPRGREPKPIEGHSVGTEQTLEEISLGSQGQRDAHAELESRKD